MLHYDILLKHEIIKTMNPGLIHTAAELHRGNTEQIGSSVRVHIKRTWTMIQNGQD